MDVHRATGLFLYGLATGVLLVSALLAGLFDPLPLATGVRERIIAATPYGGSVSASVMSAGLPMALALGLFGRAALTRGPVDVALAAFAVPCFFASLWATYSLYFTAPGAYWGGLFALGSGTLLAFAVVVDRLLLRWIRASGV